ncbi:MAG: hypothetical protein RLY57_133 [Candidatus Parcubacteria bacterium]
MFVLLCGGVNFAGAYTSPINLTQTLMTGSVGNEVSVLQEFLKEKGYFTYPTITGYFGVMSKTAVIAFQNAYQIDPIGIVGPLTRQKIYELTLSHDTVSSTQSVKHVRSRHRTRTESTVPSHTLTLSKTGVGNGIVTSSPSGINCGSTCERSYDEGNMVTLTASAAMGSVFTGWSGGGCSGTGACVVEVSADVTVTANFDLVSYLLAVTLAGTGNGMVTSSPAGISCGATCESLYSHGNSVSLTASPVMGSLFIGWSGGGCSGTGACVVTMTSATAVTAEFEIIQN